MISRLKFDAPKKKKVGYGNGFGSKFGNMAICKPNCEIYEPAEILRTPNLWNPVSTILDFVKC